MSETKLLEGKRLLIVDDEPDLVAAVKDLLDMCHIDAAADFETGKSLLNQNEYDMAILDIMGVNGYELLEIANKKGVPALMLTANALSPENFAKSISGGAKAYIPKEKLPDIAVFLVDLLKAQEGTEKPDRWFTRLRSIFSVQFGKGWLKEYRELEKKYGPLGYE